MTYEEFITKHNLHLDLTWKGFEVRQPTTKDDEPWPCFKWIYEVRRQTQHSSSLTMRGEYTQGIGHAHTDKDLYANRKLDYDPKVGLYFRLPPSHRCHPVVSQGMESPITEQQARGDGRLKARTAEECRPWFKFEDPYGGFRGPQYFVIRPTFPDILDSLRNDAECAYPTFEEFAAELGYDSDSRSAEKIYLACCEIERKLRGLVGGKGMVELLEEVERL